MQHPKRNARIATIDASAKRLGEVDLLARLGFKTAGDIAAEQAVAQRKARLAAQAREMRAAVGPGKLATWE